MIHVTTLTLCEAANVRDGLLSILSGGVTQITRPSYPAPLGLDVGITISHGEKDTALKFTLKFTEVGKKELLADAVGETTMQMGNHAKAGSISLALDVRSVAIPHAGEYLMTLAIEGAGGSSYRFSALEPHVVKL